MGYECPSDILVYHTVQATPFYSMEQYLTAFATAQALNVYIYCIFLTIHIHCNVCKGVVKGLQKLYYHMKSDKFSADFSQKEIHKSQCKENLYLN